jgi:hypothetical protein
LTVDFISRLILWIQLANSDNPFVEANDFRRSDFGLWRFVNHI